MISDISTGFMGIARLLQLAVSGHLIVAIQFMTPSYLKIDYGCSIVTLVARRHSGLDRFLCQPVQISRQCLTLAKLICCDQVNL